VLLTRIAVHTNATQHPINVLQVVKRTVIVILLEVVQMEFASANALTITVVILTNVIQARPNVSQLAVLIMIARLVTFALTLRVLLKVLMQHAHLLVNAALDMLVKI
jgi:hypothetical protein